MDDFKAKMFYAACGFVCIALIYSFICIWFKPVVDLTTPMQNMAYLLIGYYWGTSKSSADKDKANEK